MSVPGHARASSVGSNASLKGALGRGTGGLPPRVYSPVDELQRRAGVELQVTVHTSCDNLLDQLRMCNQKVNTDVSFKRPDRAYVEYTKAAEVVRLMRQHREYPYLKQDRMDRFLRLNREHEAQTPMAMELERIVEQNSTGASEQAAPSYAPPLPARANGISHQSSTPHGTAPNGSSQSRPSPQASSNRKFSGPHNELHLDSGLSNGSAVPPTTDPLVARFTQLRVTSPGSNKLPYPIDDSALKAAINGTAAIEKRSSGPSNTPGFSPDSKPLGPRAMPPAPSNVPPPPPKIPLDSLASLPKAPSPVYSPTRAPPGGGGFSQRGTPRSSVDSLDQRYSTGSSRNSYDGPPSRKRELNGSKLPLHPNSHSVTAEQLFDIFKAFSVLVIDVRSREHFDDGHIHAKSIICVEPLSIHFGMDLGELRERLVYSPESETQLLDRLSEYDLVVYHDRSTSTESFLRGSPNATVAPYLRALFDTTTEFNYGPLPRRPPVVLLGGLDSWIDLVGVQALQITQTSLVPRSQPAPKPARRMVHRASLVGQNSSREIHQRRMRAYDPLNAEEDRKWREQARKEQEKAANVQDYQVPSEAGQDPNAVSPSTVHNLEDFFRRFPEPGEIPVSMVAPRPDAVVLRPTIPTAPSRPPPAAPRPSYSGVSEGGASQQATSVRPSASAQPPRYTSRFVLQSLKLPRTGLINFGVTCYMNATIQCLVATIPVSRFFLDDSWRHWVQKNWKGSNGILPEIFSNLVRGLFRNEQAALRPLSLRTFCARLNPEWGSERQQDAKEFFDFLVDCLHEDLNTHWASTALRALTPAQEVHREGMPAHAVSRIEWDRYSHREDSFVSRLFAGQHASRLRCAACARTSTTYEAFYSISVEIPAAAGRSGAVSLQQCLESYCREERLAGDEEWRCPHCRRAREASKRIRITRLPSVLVMHLKRFSAGRTEAARKVHTRVDFPLHGLDMEPYMLDTRPPPPGRGGGEEQLLDDAVTPPFLYDAFAVMRHIGSSGSGGHYIALVKDGARGVWRKFDDDRVTDFDPARLKTNDRLQNEQAYLVFYQRAQPR